MSHYLVFPPNKRLIVSQAGENGENGETDNVLPLTDVTNEANQAPPAEAKEQKPRIPRPQKQRGPPEDGIPSTTKVMVANLPYDLSEDKVCNMSSLVAWS